jgi:hypothetical protein
MKPHPNDEQCPECGHTVGNHTEVPDVGCARENCPCENSNYDAWAAICLGRVAARITNSRDAYYDKSQCDGFNQALHVVENWPIRTFTYPSQLPIPEWKLASTYRRKHAVITAYQFKTAGDGPLRKWCNGVYAEDGTVLRILTKADILSAHLGEWVVLLDDGFAVISDGELAAGWDRPWPRSTGEIL